MIKQLFLILIGTALGSAITYYYCPTTIKNACTEKAYDLHTIESKLWADHVVWTRNYIIAAIGATADLDAAIKRLMKNQEDMGAAFIPFYGQDAGAKLTELLKDHITIAADVVTAAKASNAAKLHDAQSRWHKNADQLADFFAKANPHWPEDIMSKMLNEHLALTIHEITARLKKDWVGDIAAFDQIFNQALAMADMLADGIVRAFPDKF